MDWQRKFAYSKVAWRIFGLFIVCALVPVLALALVAFRQVTKQLNEDSRQELRHAAKSEGMAIYERLRLLDSDLIRISVNLDAAGKTPASATSVLEPDTRDLFRGVGVLSQSGLRPLFGQVGAPATFSVLQEQHLAAGRTLLLTYDCSRNQLCVRMLRYVDATHLDRGLLIGEINIDKLLNADTMSATTALCVVADGKHSIFCPAPGARVGLAAAKGHASDDFEWRDGRQAYMAGSWKLFLKPTFGASQWTVVLSKSRADILSPMKDFRRTFPVVILLTLLVVVFLTLVQIRRSMVPLQKLQAAMQQIADRKFETRVQINSADEFQQLGEGFNQMTADLGKQFRALETVREVDRAILSSLRSEEIVKTVLERMGAFLPYQAVSITLLGEGDSRQAVTYAGTGRDVPVSAVLSSQELQELHQQVAALQFDSTGPFRTYVAALQERGMKWFLVLPIRYEQRLLGVLALGNPEAAMESSDDRVYALQLADRLAVALSNARLVEELANLNMGTLRALARAIDAKSQWTSGHSERVTRMAMEIGRELGLPEKELIILHRGGMLHDIGKIGTPPGILDKPGKLTEEEFRVMREHVNTGARILEPIPGFAELIPIVLQHHERFDGSGYPQGLAGEEISIHGRIFAVADVYDALISDRPYRPGWPTERVIAFMQEQAGSHFDPRVVQAFLEVMKRENSLAAREKREGTGGAEKDKTAQPIAALRRTQCAGS